MRKILLILIILGSLNASSQVVVSANPLATPDPSAMLTLDSDKGLLIPRMTKSERETIISPVQGLWVFQTDSFPGYFVYSGAEWVKVGHSESLRGKVLFNDAASSLAGTGGYTGYTVTYPTAGEFQVTFDTPFQDVPAVMVSAESVPALSNVTPAIYCPPSFSQNCSSFINADYLDDVILTSCPGGVCTPTTPTGPISFANVNTACNNTPGNYVNNFSSIQATVYGTNVGTGGSAGSFFSLGLSSGQEWLDNLFGFIDWNQDGDFSDAQETVFEHYFTGSGTNNPAWAALITESPILVPASAVNGTSVLRCISTFVATIPDPCLNASYGEAQDYRINVLGGSGGSTSEPRATDCATLDVTSSGFKVVCVVVSSDQPTGTSFDFYATER